MHWVGRSLGILPMPFAAAIATAAATEQALDEICTRALDGLKETPDLAVLFFSAHHAAKAEWIATTARERSGAKCLLGCVGEAIVGNEREVEHRPAMSLWLARWARPVAMEPFHLELEETPDGYSLMGWPDGIVTAAPSSSALLLLGDPTTFPA